MSTIGRILRVSIFLVAVTILAYYVYFSGQFSPIILQRLSTDYSFGDILSLGVQILGKSTILALATGFIALAAFFTSLSSSGGFSSLNARLAGLFLVNQILTWLLVIMVIIGLRVFPSILLSTLLLYAPLWVLGFAVIPSFSSDLRYDELSGNSQGSLRGIVETFFLQQ